MAKINLDELRATPLTEVESSNIKRVGYNHDHKTLLLEFHSGDTYAYNPISEEGYRLLTNAESIGSFFYKHIRNNPIIDFIKI